MKFHNPYQFIPVDTKSTKTTAWREHEDIRSADNHFMRHDYWHKDGKSGRIHCNIECISPLITGNTQVAGSKGVARDLKQYQLPNGVYAIPANSLRGAIASIVEVISQSAMRVLNDEEQGIYSVRRDQRSALKKIGLIYQHDNTYKILRLPDGQAVGSYKVLTSADSTLIKEQNSFHFTENKKFVYFHDNEKNKLSSVKRSGDVKGVLYIRAVDPEHAGEMPKKISETFIEWNDRFDEDMQNGKGLILEEGIIERTEDILRRRYSADSSLQQLPKGYRRNYARGPLIKAGDLIYYHAEGNTVVELSYSAIWHKPIKRSLRAAFIRTGGINSVPWHKGRNEITPAEALFGVVEETPEAERPARNMASRIRFSDATVLGPLTAHDLIPAYLRILDSPKPPSPAMYFSAQLDRYIKKVDFDLAKHRPNGRKFYLPNPKHAECPWDTKLKKDDIENKTQYTQCLLVPAQTKFSFKIDYENLSAQELGLLLRALQPIDAENDKETFIHRLGTGKPIGLGQVKITIDRLEPVNRSTRYLSASLDAQGDQTMALGGFWNEDLVQPKALELLKTISDPQYIEAAVGYPISDQQDRNKSREQEGFKWFVENDDAKNNGQHLARVQVKNTLPTLNSRHTKKTDK